MQHLARISTHSVKIIIKLCIAVFFLRLNSGGFSGRNLVNPRSYLTPWSIQFGVWTLRKIIEYGTSIQNATMIVLKFTNVGLAFLQSF